MAVFLVLVGLVILLVLWKNGFFRKFRGIYREAEPHRKKGPVPDGGNNVISVEEPGVLAGEVPIPEWRASWYARWDEVTPRHRKFYRYWKRHLEKGDFIDIGENTGYVFMYMKLAINRFKKDRDINHLRERFERLYSAYGEKKGVHHFLCGWLSHAYLFLGDYDSAWSIVKDMGFYDCVDISHVIFFNKKCGGVSIDGEAVMNMLKDNHYVLTDFGEEHHKEIANVATDFLSHYHKKHGKNLIEDVYARFASSSLTEEDSEPSYTKIIPLFGSPCPVMRSNREISKELMYDMCSAISTPEHLRAQEIRYPAIPPRMEEAISRVLRKIVRECENIVREQKGLPRVGEGWLSEMELFRKLCESFPNEQVIHHARLAWLGRQHLDVYFPARNVAVEYQGAQHQHPIDLFGGEKAFKEQQERDMRKRLLCEKHGCRLIYAYPGYDVRDIESQIRQGYSDEDTTHVKRG